MTIEIQACFLAVTLRPARRAECEMIPHAFRGEVPARLLTGIELDFPKAASRL